MKISPITRTLFPRMDFDKSLFVMRHMTVCSILMVIFLWTMGGNASADTVNTSFTQPQQGDVFDSKNKNTNTPRDETYSHFVLFLDRNMNLVFLAAGCTALLFVPPQMPLIVVLIVMLGRIAKWMWRALQVKARRQDGNIEEAIGGGSVGPCALCGEDTAKSSDIPCAEDEDPHRSSYLMRCGHRFGFACIDSYLRHQEEKCPSCGEGANFLHIYESA